MAPNRYALWLGDGSAPIDWTPPTPSSAVRRDCVYFGGALTRLDREMPDAGLSVYLSWDRDNLPTYGPEVVAVVVAADGDARIPGYIDRVGAVFKTHGTRPFVGLSPLRDPGYLAIMGAVEGARRWARWLPTTVPVARARLAGRPFARVHHIPLGYYNQVEVPLVEPAARPVDMQFAGTVAYAERTLLSPRRWLRRPHSVARREMLTALQGLAHRRPDIVVDTRQTTSFEAHKRSEAETYSRALARAKIVLAPRGGGAETYRFFEAMRAGCVVVCEPLPPTWFYRGSPALTVRRWREMPAVVERLLGDPEELHRRHLASLEWWRTRCSEEALGAYMARAIHAEVVDCQPSPQ